MRTLQHGPAWGWHAVFVKPAVFAYTSRVLIIFNYSYLFMALPPQLTGCFLRAGNISFSITYPHACKVTILHQLWNELSRFNKISLKGQKPIYQPPSNYCGKGCIALKEWFSTWLHVRIARGAFETDPWPCVRAMKSGSQEWGLVTDNSVKLSKCF